MDDIKIPLRDIARGANAIRNTADDANNRISIKILVESSVQIWR